MKKLINLILIGVAVLALHACGEDNPSSQPEKEITKKAVVENYAKIVYQNYKDSYDAALKMQGKINAFLANPSVETMTAAKKAWLEAREPYGESEVFRGSQGPIDAGEDEISAAWVLDNEGQINAWPLNEAYIDYVRMPTDYTGTPGANSIYNQSIIARTTEITKESLAALNEDGGNDEAAVSTGWHAIEFLLWGQDDKMPSPFTDQDLSKNISGGQRHYTDFTTRKNADRRKQYLKVVTELLIDDLKALVDTWSVGGTYYKVFMALPEDQALTNIIQGPQFLAMAELSSERMLVPAYNDGGFEGCGQEDEHSCFSDNTHRDVLLNAKGIVNVLKGQYSSIKGASFIDLVKAKDAKQGEKLLAKTDEMWKAIQAIDAKAKSGTPFDVMILNEGKGSEGEVVKAANLLVELGEIIKESGAKLGLKTKNREDHEPTY